MIRGASVRIIEKTHAENLAVPFTLFTAVPGVENGRISTAYPGELGAVCQNAVQLQRCRADGAAICVQTRLRLSGFRVSRKRVFALNRTSQAFVTGPVTGCVGFCCGSWPCKWLMGNNVLDVAGKYPPGGVGPAFAQSLRLRRGFGGTSRRGKKAEPPPPRLWRSRSGKRKKTEDGYPFTRESINKAGSPGPIWRRRSGRTCCIGIRGRWSPP